LIRKVLNKTSTGTRDMSVSHLMIIIIIITHTQSHGCVFLSLSLGRDSVAGSKHNWVRVRYTTYNSIIHYITLAFWRTLLQPRLTREATTGCGFCPCKANDWLHQKRLRLLSPSVLPFILAEWMEEPFLINNKCHRFFCFCFCSCSGRMDVAFPVQSMPTSFFMVEKRWWGKSNDPNHKSINKCCWFLLNGFSLSYSIPFFHSKEKAVIEIRNRGFIFHHIPWATILSLSLPLSLSLSLFSNPSSLNR
jgi:hypothetical protein